MRTVFFVAILFLPCAGWAVGWATLRGKTQNGEIEVVPSYEADPRARDYSVSENRELFYVYVRKGAKADAPEITFKDQRCTFGKNEYGHWKTFSCLSGGESPLAGTTYTIYEASINERDGVWGEYQSEFTCVKGCDSNKNAPLKMFYSWYEGGDATSCREPADDATTIDVVTVRDKASIKGKVIAKVPENHRVHVLQRRSDCRTYEFQRWGLLEGKWVEIQATVGDQAVRGWAFGGLLE